MFHMLPLVLREFCVNLYFTHLAEHIGKQNWCLNIFSFNIDAKVVWSETALGIELSSVWLFVTVIIILSWINSFYSI